MRSLFTQLLLLVALLLGQQPVWAENNCQHMDDQSNATEPSNHQSMNHKAMDHSMMNHGDVSPVAPEQDCCNDCSCDMNSCQSQTWLHTGKLIWSYDTQSFDINLPLAWQLNKHKNELLRPPSLT